MDIYLERVVLKLTKLLSLKVFLELVVEEGGGGIGSCLSLSICRGECRAY